MWPAISWYQQSAYDTKKSPPSPLLTSTAAGYPQDVSSLSPFCVACSLWLVAKQASHVVQEKPGDDRLAHGVCHSKVLSCNFDTQWGWGWGLCLQAKRGSLQKDLISWPKTTLGAAVWTTWCNCPIVAIGHKSTNSHLTHSYPSYTH